MVYRLYSHNVKGVPGIEAVTRGGGGGWSWSAKKNLVVLLPNSIFKAASNGATHP